MAAEEPAIQAQLNACWSGASAEYDATEGHGILSEAEHAAWLSFVRGALGAEPIEVLDVGTGTGVLAFLAAELGHGVTGIDLAPGMLAAARAKAEAFGSGAPTFLEGDGVAPPFEPGRFDAVINRHVLWNLREPERALASWRELLRPGGRLVVIDALLGGEREPSENERRAPWQMSDLPAAQFDAVAEAVAMVERAGFEGVEEGDLSAVDEAEGHLEQNERRYVLTARRPSA